MFRKDSDSIGDGFSDVAPDYATQHYLTDLQKSAGFDVTMNSDNGQVTVTIIPGGTQYFSDGGGVLILGDGEPTSVDVSAANESLVGPMGAPVPVISAIEIDAAEMSS